MEIFNYIRQQPITNGKSTLKTEKTFTEIPTRVHHCLLELTLLQVSPLGRRKDSSCDLRKCRLGSQRILDQITKSACTLAAVTVQLRTRLIIYTFMQAFKCIFANAFTFRCTKRIELRNGSYYEMDCGTKRFLVRYECVCTQTVPKYNVHCKNKPYRRKNRTVKWTVK